MSLLFTEIDVFAFYSGTWNTTGVTTNVSNDTNQTVECMTSHLTSFAVMIDVHGANQVAV